MCPFLDLLDALVTIGVLEMCPRIEVALVVPMIEWSIDTGYVLFIELLQARMIVRFIACYEK